MDGIEDFWEAILSEDPARIMAAWVTLITSERAVVYAHLERMAAEEGWTAGQRDSARAALRAIQDHSPDDKPDRSATGTA